MATPRSFAELAAAPELLAAAAAAAATGGELAAAERLRARWPAELVSAAFAQAELRARAAAKFRRAGEMLFTRAGLEQASGEPVARWRARRLRQAGGEVVELCCGLGGDTLAVEPALAVDVDAGHAWLARYNAGVYGLACPVAVADVTRLRLPARSPGGPVVFADPARRGERGRGGYAPALSWCLGVASCVKAAPGLDLAAVPAGWEVEFVSLARGLKEATLWAPGVAPAAGQPPGARRATVLPAGVSLVGDAGEGPGEVGPVGEFLADPDPAVTRAGLVGRLAGRLGARQLDPRIAFLALDRPVDTPFARCLRVVESMPWRRREIAAAVRRHGIGALDIRRRGLAGDVTEIRRRLPLPAGGRRATLVMTRVADAPWALLCVDA